MPEEQFDYTLLNAEARGVVERHTAQIRALARRAAGDIIEIGRRLIEVKAQVGHGNFGPWLRVEFGWSADTAQHLMQVANRFSQIPNNADFAPTALYMQASPGVPDAACAEACERAAAGERLTVPVAQAIIRAHQPAPPAYVGVAQLAPGVRAWVGRKAPSVAAQITLLKGLQGRTTAGLIALDELLAGSDLPGPRRKLDVLLAIDSVLDELRPELTDTGQAGIEDSGQASGIRDQTREAQQVSAARRAADSAPVPGPTIEPLLLANPPVNSLPPAQTFPLTIGGVTVVHGDSQRLTEYVAPGTAHLVITSPPYNVAKDYAVHNDNLPVEDYRARLGEVFGECCRALVAGGRIAVVVPGGTGRNPWRPLAAPVADILTGQGFTLRGEIVWDKGTTGNRTSWGSWESSSSPALRDCTERIIVAHRGRGTLPLPAPAPADWLPGELFLALTQDLWHVAPARAQRIGHPAPFPSELVERLIRLYGYPGCHVVDPFSGSGTVGVAAR
jgi:modification methylase